MHTLRNKLLFYGAAAGTGLCSLALHRYMVDNCMDAKGLLIAGNLPGILLLALGVAFTVFLVLMARSLGGDGGYGENFPRDYFCGALLLAAGGALVLAAAGMETDTRPGEVPTAMGMVLHWGARLLPWAAAGAMVVLGVCRMRGLKPRALFGGVICLYYMVTLVDNYRLWSADPQLHDYAYQLLAGVLLMLCSFHRTCCDAGIIQRKKLILTGLGAAVCAVASMSMDFQRVFYLASALWAAGCICDVSVFPPDPEEEAPVASEE